MKRKVISLILAFCMVMTMFSGLPMATNAADFTIAWPTDGWTQGTPPDWALNATVEEQEATIQAIYDEFDYQASIGFDMGVMNQGLTAWGNMVAVQFENGDHTGNPWGQEGRRMGGIIAPYAGTAFSVKADFSQFYGFVPLGNQTTWTNPGDKTYMVQMGTTNQYVAAQLEDGTYETVQAWESFVGQDATNVDAFQKAYVYAAAGITTGTRLNLGLALAAVQKTADGAIEWQELRGDENTGSYGIFTADASSCGIAIIAMNVESDEAYVIEGDMFNAWKTTWVGETENDLTVVDMFSVTGAPVGNAYTIEGVTYQDFESGTYAVEDGTLTGPIEGSSTVDIVIALIDAIGEVTLNSEAAITDARAAYDALPESLQKLVTNYDVLVSAEEKIVALEVDAMIEALGEITSLEQQAQVEAARAAYDALTDEQKALVSNLDVLIAAEAVIETLKEQAGMPSPNDPQIAVASIKTTAGSQVELTVSIKNNPGFSYLEVTPEYAAELELVSVNNGTLISDLTTGKQYIWVADADVTADGELMTFVFNVSDTAEIGDYEVGFILRGCVNQNEEDVEIKIVSGTVTVMEAAYGDANGDDVIDGKDVIRLKTYLSNFDYDNNISSTEVTSGADVNGDGVIDGKDVIRLKKYLADYDYETGSSSVVLGPQA